MAAADFEDRLRRFLDGEMTVDERRRFESEMAADARIRDAVNDERAIDAHVSQALKTSIDDERRSRILAEFRRASSDVARFRKPIWRWAATAAAAVVVAFASWQWATVGERTPTHVPMTALNPSHDHDSLVHAVHADAVSFYGKVGMPRVAGAVSQRRIADALRGERGALTWIDDAATRSERLATIHRESARNGVPLSSLPPMRGTAQVVGFRIAEIKSDGARHRVPHIVLMTEHGEFSVYVLEPVHAPRVFSSLDPMISDIGREIHLHECPDCAILARCLGSHVLVVVSSMEHDDLRQVAMEL